MSRHSRRADVLAATAAASNLLSELNIPKDERIDVFAAIRKLGLWLSFQKLDNLLGATFRHGVGGMLITTERPLNIQRYTAAHELGHWVLHNDDYTWDTDATVVGASYSPREHAAQVFGAAFLMPRQLVQRTLRRLGHIRGGLVSPLIAYQASRDMGVSYEAVLTQMRTLGIITETEQSSLRSVPPIVIKTQLAGGRRPANANANVWVPAPEQLSDVVVGVGDEVVVDIPENRTTGYRWKLPSTASNLGVSHNRGGSGEQIEVVEDEFALNEATPVNPQIVGAPGRRRLILRAKNPGDWTLPLALVRSFQPESDPIERITVSGKVQLDPARMQARINAGLNPDELSTLTRSI